jgi:ribonuclease III
VLQNFIDRIRLFFRKDKESYLFIYKILGFYPHHLDLYQIAFLHKSTSVHNESGRFINNERLEFLGDAVLDVIIAHIVYDRYKNKGEGFLTNTRSKIVQRSTLNRLAVQIGLDKMIKSSFIQSTHNSYVLGNAFEAFIGAVYLDRGYKMCQRFINDKILERYINLDELSNKELNFKSHLIEWSQKNKIEISFQLISQAQDEWMNPTFETQVLIEGLVAGKGMGYSKKESQQIASRVALNNLKKGPLKEDIMQAKEERLQSSVVVVSETDEDSSEESDEKEEMEPIVESTEADTHSSSLDN